MPAPRLRPTGPSTITDPPVMYSPPWSPTPSTTAVAPELRTANRSPARPAQNSSPRVAPYRAVLPMRTGAPASSAGGRTTMRPPHALADVVVADAGEPQIDARGQEGAEALP